MGHGDRWVSLSAVESETLSNITIHPSSDKGNIIWSNMRKLPDGLASMNHGYLWLSLTYNWLSLAEIPVNIRD